MTEVRGFQVVAAALAKHNLEHCFGIVGFPCIELANFIQAEGINYYGFRNEQAASYAAGVVGYLTGKPGIVMAVSGPGMTNCISGMANAMVNKWPMICIAGASDAQLEGKGGFQEYDQLACAKPVCKYAARPSSVAHIPIVIERAVRISMYGTPGAVYIDLPGDLLLAKEFESKINYLPPVEEIPKLILPDSLLTSTLNLLKSAKNPLVIVGKGVAYGNASEQMRTFIEKSNIPFLATPMGKGVVKDTDKRSVGSARTFVLKNADVIFLCGARLNWILHFGESPRFKKDVKFIQLDNDPLEINTNVKSEIALCGDAKVILEQLGKAIKEPIVRSDSQWWQNLNQQCDKNKKGTEELTNDMTIPMNYYSTLKIIEDAVHSMPQEFMMVSEGSNTMDIGRAILQNVDNKQRLDAATFGTMGVGFGFAIAAQAIYPKKKVVMVVGDSAFGFSALEMETAARYNMPIKCIIINNNGIGGGTDEITKEDNAQSIPVNALLPGSKYELVSVAFGGKGKVVADHKALKETLKEALADNNMWVINVQIDTKAGRKPQEFSWLSRAESTEDKPKL